MIHLPSVLYDCLLHLLHTKLGQKIKTKIVLRSCLGLITTQSKLFVRSMWAFLRTAVIRVFQANNIIQFDFATDFSDPVRNPRAHIKFVLCLLHLLSHSVLYSNLQWMCVGSIMHQPESPAPPVIEMVSIDCWRITALSHAAALVWNSEFLMVVSM